MKRQAFISIVLASAGFIPAGLPPVCRGEDPSPAEAVNLPYEQDHGMGVYEADQQKTSTLKVRLATIRLVNPDDKGWNLRLKLPVSVGIHNIESLLLDEDGADRLTDRVRTFAFYPELEADIPVSRWWTFKPKQELGVAYDDIDRDPVYLAATDLRMLYITQLGSWRLGITPGAKYGFSWDGRDGLTDDYLSLTTSVEAKNPIMGLKLGRRHVEYSVFFKASYFVNELEFDQPGGEVLEVNEQYEVGAKLYTNPRKIWWKLKVPQVSVSYRLGDDLKGIRFKLGL